MLSDDVSWILEHLLLFRAIGILPHRMLYNDKHSHPVPVWARTGRAGPERRTRTLNNGGQGELREIALRKVDRYLPDRDIYRTSPPNSYGYHRAHRYKQEA